MWYSTKDTWQRWTVASCRWCHAALIVVGLGVLGMCQSAQATTIEFNSGGGTSATNGLHFYIDDSTQIQVKRLNNTGQVFENTATPPNVRLDNGVWLRANGLVYGPSHTVGNDYTPSGRMYNTHTLTAASPANPSAAGVQQTATGVIGITSGPQVTIVWKYTTPLDFLTAEVTLVIPSGFSVSAANPVRYSHVFDTYLGGSDQGCGFSLVDANGKRVIGTYPPTSGSTCPTSTSIPAGVSVVESFRERSGATFSNYCASDYYSFYDTSTPNCSVRQAAAMSNKVTTTYQDTGIGVQYSFTAAGTYTFSYDFVVGSPNVPAYDHLEIQHDGSGTLCPDTVTVLACTSSTIPCPSLSRVNSGTLTGTLTATAPPSVTMSPSSAFTLGASGTTDTVSLQAAAAGTVTLGTSGLSTVPLNGTKCWNTTTSTQSCSLTFSNTPCISGYECQETGTTYNNLVTTPSAHNPLYTKLSGTDFKFDVIALQSSGAQATSYTAAANVTVELFDDSASPAPSCNAYTNPIASQPITFVAGDNGRKQVPSNFNLAKAYSKVRCRVKDSNISPTLYGCSSDDFAVRPQQFTISSTNANADAAGSSATATPKIKASSAFNLTADTNTVGYGGTPTINAANAEAHTGAIQVGALAGTFGAASTTTGNGATGSSFSYGEVGYFRFNADGVVDSTYAGIDSASNDCVVGSSSNTLSGGKYGCNIGNAVSPYFGRFIPDHFDTTVTLACGGAFTYSGQPFPVTVTAMNGAATPLVTQNYDGGTSFSKATTLTPVNSVGGTAIAGSVGALSSGAATAASFRKGTTNILGTVSVTNGSATVTGTGTAFLSQLAAGSVVCLSSKCYTVSAIASNASLTLASNYAGATASGQTLLAGQTFTFASKQTVPTGVYVRAVDGDSVTSLRASSVEGGGFVRSGRIRLVNAYGSELLAAGLRIPAFIEYYDTAGAAGWRTGADTCTVISNTDFAFTFYGPTTKNQLAACETTVTVTGVNPTPNVQLSRPGSGNFGYTDVRLNLGSIGTGSQCVTVGGAGPGATTVNTTGATWLRYPWTSSTESDPVARATFGVFKSPLIYRRENY